MSGSNVDGIETDCKILTFLGEFFYLDCFQEVLKAIYLGFKCEGMNMFSTNLIVLLSIM